MVRYLEWEAASWNERAAARDGESEELRGGIAGYAKHKVAMYTALAACFRMELGVSAEGSLRAIMVGEDEDDEDEGIAQLFTAPAAPSAPVSSTTPTASM